VAVIFQAQSLSARGLLEPQPARERFLAVPPGRCDSDRTDGCWVRRCSFISNNAGLCGPVVPLSTGAAYESASYADTDDNGIGGTALGTDCPTVSPTIITPTIVGQTWTPTTTPTSAPTSPTVSPTTASPTTVSPTATPNPLEDNSSYQACIASPSTCTRLYVPPSSSCPPDACRPSAAVLARGSGGRERLDTSP
jgi:hypothetical protein